MLRVQQVCVEERVEFGVELRVVQVFLLNKVEKTGQGEERDGTAFVVRVRQEVHQKFRSGEPGLDDVYHNTQKGFPLRLREIIPKDGQPRILCLPLVTMNGAKPLVIRIWLCEEVFKIDLVIGTRGFVAGREEGNEDLDNVGLSSDRGILALKNQSQSKNM